MQGYDPDQQRGGSEPGGCRETLLMTSVAFELLLPPLLVIVAILTLIVSAFFLLAVHPALSLLPMLPVVAATIWMIRRDRRIQRELEDEINPPPR